VIEQEEQQEEQEEQVIVHEDLEGLVKPRPREIRRRDDREELTRRKVENFFGLRLNLTFYDGTGSTPDHDSMDLEVAHSLGEVPDDIIVGLVRSTLAQGITIRKGLKHWTSTYIYLRANAACSAIVYLVK